MAQQSVTTRRKAGKRGSRSATAPSNGRVDHALVDDARLLSRAALAEGLDSARDLRRAALAGAGLMGADPAPVSAANADVVDEMEKGGPAFGSFLKSVGLAVAESQKQLDQDLVETAKALSNQTIDVIAIWEQQLDDNGNMAKGNPVVQKLPLINYLMPTAYNFSRVYLQADMSVSEFNGANGFNIQGHSASASLNVGGSYGMFGGSVHGNLNASASTFGQSVNTSSAIDTAAGKLHMEATLEPRGDIQLPQPFVVQKGPQLKVSVGSQSDILSTPANAGDPVRTIGRKVTLTAKLTGTAGAASGKSFDIRLSDPALGFTITTAGGKTDQNGELAIEVTRSGAAFDPARPAQPVSCKVWLNLLAQDVGFNI